MIDSSRFIGLFIVFKVCAPVTRHNSIERSHDVCYSVASASPASRAKLGPLQLGGQEPEYTGAGKQADQRTNTLTQLIWRWQTPRALHDDDRSEGISRGQG